MRSQHAAMNYSRILTALLFTLLVPLFSMAHHTRQANFTFEEEEGMLNLTIVLEEIDLVTAIKAEVGCDPSRSLGICANWYIKNHLQCAINGRGVTLKYSGTKYNEDQIAIKFTINHFVQEIKTISLENDCFLPVHNDFVNSIVFLIGNFEKSYSMDRKKQELLARF